jgi:hypothetical protein
MMNRGEANQLRELDVFAHVSGALQSLLQPPVLVAEQSAAHAADGTTFGWGHR